VQIDDAEPLQEGRRICGLARDLAGERISAARDVS